MVRAKFQVASIKQVSWSNTHTIVGLNAVYDDGLSKENKSFAKATPSGTIEITIDNPPAAEFFSLGKYVYVDFSDAQQ